ncbi:hypothetical protein LBMAG16_09450 [Actinomycetes bacterium]|nr:hypothetical protein LBMAG16_09450 [Actinomycetes bacterium]
MSDKPNLKHNYGTINKEYGLDLATRAPENDGPIYMVNLMKYHEVAQYQSEDGMDKAISGRDADDRYNPASILSKIGADIVFVADVNKSHVGSEDWDRIAIARYATRKSFIEMQSRKDFGEKHKHKAAGMQRTIIVCCRPEDIALDRVGRPNAGDSRTVLMVVRQTDDRQGAFSQIDKATNFSAEGTIIGDGRMWDTVQFKAFDSQSQAYEKAASLKDCSPGSSFVMTLDASMDAITTR